MKDKNKRIENIKLEIITVNIRISHLDKKEKGILDIIKLQHIKKDLHMKEEIIIIMKNQTIKEYRKAINLDISLITINIEVTLNMEGQKKINIGKETVMMIKSKEINHINLPKNKIIGKKHINMMIKEETTIKADEILQK